MRTRALKSPTSTKEAWISTRQPGTAHILVVDERRKATLRLWTYTPRYNAH